MCGRRITRPHTRGFVLKRVSRVHGTAHTLALAGVDVLIGEDHVPRILEVNDHPSGWTLLPSVFERFVELLQVEAGGDAAAIVLPECFRVATKTRVSWSDVAPTVPDAEDLRTTRALEEINKLRGALEERGIDTLITDGPSLAAVSSLVKFGVIFDRSDRDVHMIGATIVNPAARSICADKLSMYSTLRRADPAMPATEPFTISDASELRPFAPSTVVVWKPRFGGGSVGVTRGAFLDVPPTVSHDLIVERWVKPATVMMQDREYHVDLRVFVVGGIAVGTVIRRASAPIELVSSPLGWLTTTGPVIAEPFLQAGISPSLAVAIRHASTVAERAVAVVNQELLNPLAYSRRAAGVFGARNVIDEPLRIVEVAPLPT